MEILCETDADRADEDLATLKQCMLDAASEYVTNVKVTAEAKADTFWNKA